MSKCDGIIIAIRPLCLISKFSALDIDRNTLARPSGFTQAFTSWTYAYRFVSPASRRMGLAWCMLLFWASSSGSSWKPAPSPCRGTPLGRVKVVYSSNRIFSKVYLSELSNLPQNVLHYLSLLEYLPRNAIYQKGFHFQASSTIQIWIFFYQIRKLQLNLPN